MSLQVPSGSRRAAECQGVVQASTASRSRMPNLGAPAGWVDRQAYGTRVLFGDQLPQARLRWITPYARLRHSR